MQITNKMNLPEALVQACEVSQHNRPYNLSATTLLKGVREILLAKRHWDEMSEDVSDRIWALFGTAIHSLLERETPDTFVEESFFVPVGEYKITGRLDCYDMKQGIIHDYKSTSVWKIIKGDFEDWRQQGLIYAWLLAKQGLPVRECRFTAILKDHSKSKAKFERNYPKTPVYVYSFTVTNRDLAEIEKFILSKVEQVAENVDKSDSELPLCSDHERWARPTTYAVMKAGRKTALRVFDTKEQAEKYIADTGIGYIEERKGSDGKCPEYCSCCEWCSYYKEHYAKGGSECK